MRVLWVYAHPQGRSLNAALLQAGTDVLRRMGHEVVVSDLYAMGWKASLDAADLGDAARSHPELTRASRQAYETGALTADIWQEQEKLAGADAVVLQFPLWWYSVPAILKGWIDRVFDKGFAYGVRDAAGRTLRYGDGVLAGTPVQVIVTTGSPPAAMGPRGINGQLDQVLFPLLHGTLWYVGMRVLPPLAVHGADRVDPDGLQRARAAVQGRVTRLWDLEPIRYRYQNRGDYDDDLVLREEHLPGSGGLAVHLRP
ncbi:NAD(P)H-dependent oxidoreductase [Georgenia sp. 10Sc9-8]|uniref:NAD(P)H-dependent oxidoreductase n=1 Tax=Georgenia halotolerans TaxID=3028317 RepID=A0ABT5TVW4_9MICO|nr:NAD(P)H-dependent oxidoreductase [Georgenia halotolerans]